MSTRRNPRADDPPDAVSDLTRQVGARIRAARRASGLTQDEIAQRGGPRQATLSNYENGRDLGQIDKIDELMRLLGSDITALFCGADDPIVTEAGRLLLELGEDPRAMIMDTLRGAVARQRARRTPPA